MPRKAFIADLQIAQVSTLPQAFSNLRPGDEDGSLTISYRSPGFASQTVKLQAQVSDVGDYPSEHSFFVYSTSDNAPSFVNDILSDPSNWDGLKVAQLITKLAKQFDDHTRGSSHNPFTLDSDDEPELIEIDDDDDDDDHVEPEDNQEDSDQYDSDEDHFDLHNDFGSQKKTASGTTNAGLFATDQMKRDFNAGIRSELSRLKVAGFRVSCCTSPFDFARDFYLTVSCRIAKLNISEDALAAWGLAREKYILLMFHFTDGYKTTAEILAESEHGRSTVSYRLAVSTKWKGPRQDTIDSFSTAHDRDYHKIAQSDNPLVNDHDGSDSQPASLEKFFIDRPLIEMMNGPFINVMRLRQKYNFSWDGAERFCQDHQASANGPALVDERYYRPDPIVWRTQPSLRVGDHFAIGGAERVFPLVAMEFMLRHLVQCTDFCLVCHTKLDSEFEALKPYVCSKPLCLYQYMALGFGPSIEHEILSQPYVVDLLVSFCYTRAIANKLEDLPIGMGLTVPSPSYIDTVTILGSSPGQPMHSYTSNAFAAAHPSQKLGAVYDEMTQQLTFPNAADAEMLRSYKPADWVVIDYERVGSTGLMEQLCMHRRITSTALSPTFQLAPSQNDQRAFSAGPTPPVTANGGAGIQVSVSPFHTKFDDISKAHQSKTIIYLLNTLPSVSKMKVALLANRTKSVAQICTDVSPAALGILRWIIASNRSCIVAIDDLQSGIVNAKDRCAGMPGFMQFRFAQGAPDKEQRFMEAVKATQTRLRTQTPTLWAWHGSSMENWHSIIREGLHYKAVVNGRAYGDGIYNALDVNISLGYSANRSTDPSVKLGWKSSELNMSTALSLNEIVNAPSEFKSHSPYLVVGNVDWVQTRILFVKCNVQNTKALEDVPGAQPDEVLEQDQRFCSKGTAGPKLIIPANAISASRRKQPGRVSKGLKKIKLLSGFGAAIDDIEEVFMSDTSDDEDRLLYTEPPDRPVSLGKGKAVVSGSSMTTDFVPGSLDVSKLPCLPLPPFATPQASKALSRALKELQKQQNTTPTAELGWHLCEEALDNIYQWIVELHTFDPAIPLYTDLKKKDLTSVVMELRFGPSYPFSPPFIRVIKPRFLSFIQGGGGHVTAGGSLCMELLTNDGWSAVSSIEAVLLQVKMAISSVDPRPARLPPGSVGEYSAGEAIEAYKRACMTHGWTVPPDLLQIGQASQSHMHGIGGSRAG